MSESAAVAPQPELLTRVQVAGMTGLSPPTIDRYRGKKIFPQPIRLGPNRVAWLRSEIDAWIRERVAERDRQS